MKATYAPVSQWQRNMAKNHDSVGSSPTWSTSLIKAYGDEMYFSKPFRSVGQWLACFLRSEEVAGSNPAIPTKLVSYPRKGVTEVPCTSCHQYKNG